MVDPGLRPTAIDWFPNRSCNHHWIIQPSNGPVSRGLCQLCGEGRQFKNYIEESPEPDDLVLQPDDFDR